MKSQACKVKQGTIISGKWHKNSYEIVKPLGYGANGIVYLANSLNGLVALKISESSTSITSEVNVLKHFSKVQGSALGPSLLDVDDWILKGNTAPIPFYVMEYIEGETFLSFVEKRGKEWIGVLILQLLSDLERMHQQAWVFGDLKPDNLLVTGNPPKIRCIDVGGTTVQGRSIKEFTEFFDRGYWGAGTRKAEPSYDLFAVAMVIINTAYPKRFPRNANGNGKEQLKQVINGNAYLKKYEKVLNKAINGTYHQAIEMRKDIVLGLSQTKNQTETFQPNISRSSPKRTKPQQQKRHQGVRTNKKSQKKKGSFIETVLILIFVCLGYMLYIYGQLF
jgi:serine/threonine protein kinase, bacterial